MVQPETATARTESVGMKSCQDCGEKLEWEGAPCCGACFSIRCEERGLSAAQSIAEIARIAGVPPEIALLAGLSPPAPGELEDGERRMRLRKARRN